MDSNLPDLWKHQVRAITSAKLLPHFALFHDVGTGKTRSCIRILADKYNESKRVLRTVILCPIIVTKNWPREIEKFSNIKADRVFVAYNKNPKKRYENLKKALEQNNGNMIIVVNFEGTLDETLMKMIMAWNPEVLVVDESQRCKNPQAKRTKNTIKLADLTKNRFILSGTPVLNSPMDVWAQYRILDKGETFGKNFFSFRATYFMDRNAGMPQDRYFPDWVPRKEMMDDLNARIYKIADRAVKSECLDLPPLVRIPVYVDLSPKQRRLYDDLRDDFVAYLDGGEGAVVADLAITKALRLQQIVSGYVKLEDGSEITFEDTEREKALEELLEDVTPNHKVIIWAVFKHNYEAIRKICDKLKIKYVEAHGDVSANQKLANVDTFNNDTETRVFIGHPASLGVGINLVVSSVSVYYSRNFSLENDLQSEARNYRGGSEIHESITRYDLIARNTIDEQVVEALMNKLKISDKVLRQFITQMAA